MGAEWLSALGLRPWAGIALSKACSQEASPDVIAMKAFD